jgi:hypothetical protein
MCVPISNLAVTGRVPSALLGGARIGIIWHQHVATLPSDPELPFFARMSSN